MISVPLFKKENLAYERQEKDGYWTVIPKFHPETKEIIINKTAREILELCDGVRSIEDIINSQQNKYTAIAKDIISRDVDLVLSSYSRLSMVVWSGENPYLFRRERLIDETFGLRVGTEEDLSLIVSFFHECGIFKETFKNLIDKGIVTYKSPFVFSESYSELTIRQKLFSFSEEFFMLFQNEKLVGILAISMPFGLSKSASIEFLACPKAHCLQLIDYAHSLLPHICVRDLTKVKIPFDKFIDPILTGLFQEAGYSLEATLKNEYGFDTEIMLHTYFYDKKIIEDVMSQRRNLVIQRN